MQLIQEGFIEKQKEEEKYKEALKSAKQEKDNDEAIAKIEKAEQERLKKRKEVIAEKKKKILEAQKALEDAKKKDQVDATVTDVEVFEDYVTTTEWWDELLKVANEKISVRPSYNAPEQGQEKKKTDEQMTKILWGLMTSFDNNDLQIEHSKSINQLHSMQRKSCLQDLINQAQVDQVMPLMLQGENGKRNFSRYLKVQFNSSVIQMLQIGQKGGYKNLKQNINDIFNYCDKDEKFKEVTKYFLVEEIIKSGIKSIKDFQETKTKNVIDYFQQEEKASTGLNPYLLRYFTKYLIKNESKLLSQTKNCITNLMNLHMLMVIYFNQNVDLIKKLLKTVIQLITFCQDHAEELAKSGELDGVIQNKLINLCTKSTFYGKDSDKKFSIQQLFLLEIHLKIDELWKRANDDFGIKITKVLEDSKEISKLKQ